jgi:hypothetical protein
VRPKVVCDYKAIKYSWGEGLALRIGQPPIVARDLLRAHHETYRTFWRWSDAAVDCAMLHGSLHTVFGWHIHVDENANPRSLRNLPMQANGAEMLRLACCRSGARRRAHMRTARSPGLRRRCHARLHGRGEPLRARWTGGATLSYEDRRVLTTAPWRGERRWFRSANIVALERYRSQDEWRRICAFF